MGLGGISGRNEHFIGMLGMHGTYEANMAMHDCDVMLNIGARFDDRITGLVSKFSPNSKKIHIDIDDVSIDKIINVDVKIISDAQLALEKLIEKWQELGLKNKKVPLKAGGVKLKNGKTLKVYLTKIALIKLSQHTRWKH